MLPLRIMYLAYYVFGKSRANLPTIKFNFSVSNAFLPQLAVEVERASNENLR